MLKNDPALGRHLIVAAHETIVRGVSTAFLHHAAEALSSNKGGSLSLYFSNATLYAADPSNHRDLPTAEEIGNSLKMEIDRAIRRDMSPLMVGSPTGQHRTQSRISSLSASPGSTSAVPQAKSVRKTTAKRSCRQNAKWLRTTRKLQGRTTKSTDAQVEEEAARISVAQPEMLV